VRKRRRGVRQPSLTRVSSGCDHRGMKVGPPRGAQTQPRTGFDLAASFASLGLVNAPILYPKGHTIFKQGDPATHVMFLQMGGVKVAVASKSGREAIVGLFGPGDFFGEGCLAGQPLHHGSAIAVLPSAVLSIPKNQMAALLRKQLTVANQFIAHMLARNSRIESDLLDQLFKLYGEAAGARAVAPGRTWYRPDTVDVRAENLPGHARRNHWRDAFASEFLLEQVQETRLHHGRRCAPADDRPLSIDRAPAR